MNTADDIKLPTNCPLTEEVVIENTISYHISSEAQATGGWTTNLSVTRIKKWVDYPTISILHYSVHDIYSFKNSM